MEKILVLFSQLTSVKLLFLIILFSSQSQNPPVAAAQDDLIYQTCKQTPLFLLCISTLRKDPRSKTAANVQDLGLIIVDILKSKAVNISTLIKHLMPVTFGPQMKQQLRNCKRNYEVIHAIIGAEKAPLTRNLKFALDAMVAVAMEANQCEKKLEALETSVLSELNKSMSELATVGIALIRMLLYS